MAACQSNNVSIYASEILENTATVVVVSISATVYDSVITSNTHCL